MKILGPMAAMSLVAALGVGVANAAPPITEAQRTKIIGVPDGSITSGGVTRHTYNMGGLVIVGADAYQIKADNNETNGTGWTTFYHIVDFQTSGANLISRTVTMRNGTAPVDLGHANDMAYYPTPGADHTEVGSFYIAMSKTVGDYQVAQVNATGEVTALFRARQGSVEKSISSITSYGSGIFIVGTHGENVADEDDEDIIWKPYYRAIIDGGYFELADKFYVPTTRTYNTGQGIYYEPADDELLVPVWDGKNTLGTATGRKSRVVVVELGNIADGTRYHSKRWIDLTVSASDAQKFEFEGISRDPSGKLIISANVVTAAGAAADGIYKISAAQE